VTFTSPEVELFITRSLRECDRILAALEGLSREQANWRPVEGANSIAVLATHMPANIREVLLGVVLGRPVVRDREAEFETGDRDPEVLRTDWVALRAGVTAAFEPLTSAALDDLREHPRRGPPDAGARHAAEHAGQGRREQGRAPRGALRPNARFTGR